MQLQNTLDSWGNQLQVLHRISNYCLLHKMCVIYFVNCIIELNFTNACFLRHHSMFHLYTFKNNTVYFSPLTKMYRLWRNKVEYGAEVDLFVDNLYRLWKNYLENVDLIILCISLMSLFVSLVSLASLRFYIIL